jgi:hypothetical protein
VTAELAAQRRVLVPRGDIFLEDDVASAERSRAELQLGHDTSLRLGANARVRIDRFIVNAGGVLTLDDGPLLLDKAPGTGGALFIRGQFGLIAIGGTRIFVGPSNGVIGVLSCVARSMSPPAARASCCGRAKAPTWSRPERPRPHRRVGAKAGFVLRSTA